MVVALEITMALIMVGGVIVVFVCMFKEGSGSRKGLVQFLALILVIPSVFILSLEGRFSIGMTGALFGTILGFALAGLVRD